MIKMGAMSLSSARFKKEKHSISNMWTSSMKRTWRVKYTILKEKMHLTDIIWIYVRINLKQSRISGKYNFERENLEEIIWIRINPKHCSLPNFWKLNSLFILLFNEISHMGLNKTYARDDISFSLFSPFSDFGIDLITNFPFDFTCVTWKIYKK